MTEKRDQHPVERTPDPELPSPHDMFSGVIHELERHARVMRRAVRRVLRNEPHEGIGGKVRDSDDDDR